MKVANIIFIAFAILILVIAAFAIYQKSENGKENQDQFYSGPVPEWADEEHFRQTGETIAKKTEG